MSEPIASPTEESAAAPAPEAAAPAPPATPERSGGGATDPRRKSPFLACLLSVMPGLGQVYVGYYQRGFMNALVVGTLVTLLVAEVLGPLIPLASIFLAFFVLYNIVDAGRRASLYNQALAGGGEIELPDDLEAPGLHGSMAGGVVLVAVGSVLLFHTLFRMPLDWVERWWPLVFVGFGAYLVWRAMEERRSGQESLD